MYLFSQDSTWKVYFLLLCNKSNTLANFDNFLILFTICSKFRLCYINNFRESTLFNRWIFLRKIILDNFVELPHSLSQFGIEVIFYAVVWSSINKKCAFRVCGEKLQTICFLSINATWKATILPKLTTRKSLFLHLGDYDI